ncbi:MAG: hypothetical protein ACRD8A_15555 [Candidatus Acidiferrales bacterium]
MRKIILVILFFVCPFVLHADTYYQFTLSNVTFVGNNNCSGPCTEVLNGQFVLDLYAPLPGQEPAGVIVPGTLSFTATGPLGHFVCCVTGSLFQDAMFIDPPGANSGEDGIDEFEILNFPEGGATTNPFIQMDLCQTAACSADFCSLNPSCLLYPPIAPYPTFSFPPTAPGGLLPTSGDIAVEEVSRPVPEPRAAWLLGLGVLAVLGLWSRRRDHMDCNRKIIENAIQTSGVA